MKGTMARGVKLLGTQLELVIGQAVRLEPTDNLPPESGDYFASPIDGCWGEDSICIDADDVKIDA